MSANEREILSNQMGATYLYGRRQTPKIPKLLMAVSTRYPMPLAD